MSDFLKADYYSIRLFLYRIWKFRLCFIDQSSLDDGGGFYTRHFDKNFRKTCGTSTSTNLPLYVQSRTLPVQRGGSESEGGLSKGGCPSRALPGSAWRVMQEGHRCADDEIG